MSTKNSYINNFPEISCPPADSLRSSMPAGIGAQGLHQVAAGRLGVCAILVVFIACYLYGINNYGVILGVGLGWLPSAFIAWLAASVIGFSIDRTRQTQ